MILFLSWNLGTWRLLNQTLSLSPKVCDNGILHLGLLSFWNLPVIWCFEHNRTWGLSLFWNVPHHWVIGARCFETTWWSSQHVRHQSPSVLEPHPTNQRTAALLHKLANSLNSTDHIYRVSKEERTKLWDGVPYVKLYRYNPKHLYPKLNGYGDNGHRKVWASVVSTYCKPSVMSYSSTAQARERETTI